MSETTGSGQSGETPAPETSAGAEPAAPPAVPDPSAASPAYALPSTPGKVDQIAGEAIAADQDFSEHYKLLFASVGLFLGALFLPIEGRHYDLHASHSISGGFLTIFAGYGVLAGWMNIHSRKMIVWPVFFAAADGLYVCGMRAMQLIGQVEKPDEMDFRGWIHLFGSGWYVIAMMSLYVIWTLLTAVMSGAKKEQARKEAAKAARSSRK